MKNEKLSNQRLLDIDAVFLGVFVCDCLKGYYPFKMFNTLYSLKNACECKTEDADLYCAAAVGESGKAVMISYYTDDDTRTDPREIRLDFVGCEESFEVLLLDAEHDAETVATVKNGDTVTLLPNTVCLLKTL